MRFIDLIINLILSKWFLRKNRLKLAELNPMSRSIWLALNNHEQDRLNHFWLR